MIIVLKENAPLRQTEYLREWLESRNCGTKRFENEEREMLLVTGIPGDTDIDFLGSLEFVEAVTDIEEPYKAASRKLHPEDSVIEVAGRKIGNGNFVTIAGPCSVESEEQIIDIAEAVKAAGADFLRGGAFKPRTSPYDFQGLEADGIKLLELAKAATGLPIISEVVDVRTLPLFENVDIIQVGARNMQNFGLLKTLGGIDKPVLLKRGLCATYKELLTSAEYIMAEGNSNVILCERGVRTFEGYTRNTLDIGAVPALRKLSHLPVIVDPSHGTGRAGMVEPMALAAVAAGADGLMIEVHNDPMNALSDGEQSITPDDFAGLMDRLSAVRRAVNGE